jgi:hypothetical protein
MHKVGNMYMFYKLSVVKKKYKILQTELGPY